MKRFVAMMLAVALTCVLASGAWAAEGKKGGKKDGGKKMTIEQRFNALDKDGDKQVSLDEFKASPRFKDDQAKAKAEGMFKKIDADGNGKVSVEEFKKAMEDMAKKHAEKKGDKK